MFNNPIQKHMCASYLHSRSLIVAFVKLDLNSLQPPKPPLFFCELISRESVFVICSSVSSVKNSGDMKLKKPPPNFFQQSNLLHVTHRYPLLESLKQWLLKPMRRTWTFVERDLCVSVMFLLGMCHSDLGAACWCCSMSM